MPKLFRALLKKNKWFWDEPLPWLEVGDIPADPLEHLIPQDHKISVYEVSDDREQIERVAAAIAAKRHGEVDAVEFIVFDQSILAEVGIEIDRNTPGDTCDPEVNGWHRDMIEVSADKLVAFAKRVVPNIPSDLVLKKRIREVLIESGGLGLYDWSKINLRGRDKLHQEIRQSAEHNPTG